jgi:hypothetical protein
MSEHWHQKLMNEAKSASVAIFNKPGLNVVHADDLPTYRDRPKVAETQKPTPYEPRELSLNPELRHPRFPPLANNANRNCLEGKSDGRFARRHDLNTKSLCRRMFFRDQRIESSRDLAGVANDAVGPEGQEITVDGPGLRAGQFHRLLPSGSSWAQHHDAVLAKVAVFQP